jgi:hypothetical protein
MFIQGLQMQLKKLDHGHTHNNEQSTFSCLNVCACLRGSAANINPATKIVIPAVAESRNPGKALGLLDSRVRENDGMVEIRWSI